MTVESTLEFDTCFHFEYSLNITSFEAQPEGYYYNYLDKKLPYTPDFFVVDKIKGMRFIEVKPLSKVSDPEFREKFICRHRDAQSVGVPVVLVTEKQIRLNPILNNLK
ncbi:MAG: Tn7 transposase TnsA N-terminal domain-containing protein, partial [Pseudomonadales bacterium]